MTDGDFMADYEEYFGVYYYGEDTACFIERQITKEARQYEDFMDRLEESWAIEEEFLKEEEYDYKKSNSKKFASHKAFNNDIKNISDEEFLTFRNHFLTFFCRNKQTFLSAEELHQITQALKTLKNLYSKIQATASLNSGIIKYKFPDEYEKLINDKDEFHKRILTKTIENAIFVNDMTSKRIDSYLNKIADNKR